MGMVLGRISVETPNHEVLASTPDYEIRKYPASVIAEVTYDPAAMKNDRDAGFMILANYIGAFGSPQNSNPDDKIAMTAPVITHGGGGGEKIVMTAPVVTSAVTMQFILPAKFTRAEEAPRPLDERVRVREEGERKYGVESFKGIARERDVEERAARLKERLERDGYKVKGEFLLARYNPPWTLPPFRTNEIFVPLE